MSTDPTTLELLRMAREIAINEYTDRRAQDHNQWVIESDHLWRTQRLRLAYPSFPPYPTEDEIILRAKKLMEFVGIDPANLHAAETPPVSAEVEEVVEEAPPQSTDKLDNVDPEVTMTPADLDYIRTKVLSDMDESVSSSQRLIPALVKKIENLKSSLLR